MKRLHWCNNCKENSVVVEVYTRKKDGKLCRVKYCINKGCGYKQDLPFPDEVKRRLENAEQGQVPTEHNNGRTGERADTETST